MLQITEIPAEGYERVCRGVDTASGLHAIIAVHSTALGPALGGMRLWPYESRAQALTDVLRLSRSMTYKAACSGLDLGGGKSVILGDTSFKSTALFEAMGDFVDSFGGSYITAEDVNTKVEDMGIVATQTKHVVGLAGKSGNPSPVTAMGTFLGLQATIEDVFGSAELAGKTVAVEGVGAVGSIYAKLIAENGGNVVLADIRGEAAARVADEIGGTVVDPDEIHAIDCDIFAPCALGGSLNDETIPKLKAKIVCGAANNQLLEARHGEELRDRGIKYAPDYVVNAGGLINVYNELVPGGYSEERAFNRVQSIRVNMKSILEMAREEKICTSVAADRFAEARIQEALAGHQP
ncbi:MAG TPA: leucine dehydrogenase [Planctomycetes bacterium]|nr:leucine dehydrogenase [Planctomycetota bacterium]